jgi:type II secretory pathway component GspD/PulD (secretin)
LIQQDLNGDGDLDDAGETEFANVPQEFVSRDIGIILQVTPSVGIDSKTITLSIVPEVSQVAQTPAKFPITSYDSNGNEVQQSSGTPNLPRFTTSTLSTTVVLESGQTAVLGGLIQESRGVTEEKFPLLGDIPYVGFFFRSKQDSIDRSNLVIFITARVVSS